MQPTARWLLALAGVLLLVGAPTAWYLQQPAETVGELPAGFEVASGDEGQAASAPTGPDPVLDETESDTTAVPDVDVDTVGDERDADDEVAARPAPPVGVSIPSIGVETATVVDVALDDRGAVEIPDDVQEVGWYRRGPRPGEDGNAFMTSHVDSRTQGRGVLFDLRRVEPGDEIIVDHEDGTTSNWEVVRRERITKGSYPMEQVFRFDGEPGLVIDTCGGAFNPQTGSYENIDIVYAVPLGADYSTVDVEAAAQTG